MLELPHTHGCLVCGRGNPHGLKLSLFVDPATGVIHTTFDSRPEHIGFDGIIHGGVLATIVDEAMVWCATWSGKRFCVAAEMSVRFVRPAAPGMRLKVEAKIDSHRSRLITASAIVLNEQNEPICTAAGKYVPVGQDHHAKFMQTMLPEPTTRAAAAALSGAPA